MKKMVTILHLCLAFTVIMGSLFAPFFNATFSQKTLSSLYTRVTEDPLFSQLSQQEQQKLQSSYQLFQESAPSFSKKMESGIDLLLFGLPSFIQLWLLFSILIPILLLLNIPSSFQAVWLLPLITLLFAIDNRVNGYPPTPIPLLPSEEQLIANHLNEPFSSSIKEQRKQLETAWKHFLITEWTEETPSNDSNVSECQVKKGEFVFHHAWLTSLLKDAGSQAHSANQKRSVFILGLYLLWNGFFATIMCFSQQQLHKQTTQITS